MPMRGIPIVLDGKVVGIACTRGNRYAKCSFCKGPDGKLECDGCDKVLCPACSVAPTSKLDYCPTCAEPAFRWWKENWSGKEIYANEGRASGRMKFRAWVRVNKKKFNELVGPRSKASKVEVPKP